jgi:hypothetical protein
VTEPDPYIAELATAWRQAERELQLLRSVEPAEAQERAERARIAYLRASASGRSRLVSETAFRLRFVILLLFLAAPVVRMIFRR